MLLLGKGVHLPSLDHWACRVCDARPVWHQWRCNWPL